MHHDFLNLETEEYKLRYSIKQVAFFRWCVLLSYVGVTGTVKLPLKREPRKSSLENNNPAPFTCVLSFLVKM